MSKPFQFSMRRMLGAVTLFCAAAFVGATAFKAGIADAGRGTELAVTLVAIGAILGAAVGLLTRRPWVGAMIGASLVFIVLLMFFFAMMSSFT